MSSSGFGGKKTGVAIGLVLLAVIAIVAAVVAMKRSAAPGAVEEEPVNGERYTLIYGGDLITARRLNLSLWHEDQKERRALFGDLVPEFREADIAMINLEGMISLGGYFNRLRWCTWLFRAHPRLLEVLKWMGMDLLILGNNHMGDYGRAAVVETVDHIMEAGLEYAGAGVDIEDASRPAYMKVGDVVVAIVSAELTIGGIYRAEKDKPGVYFVHPAFRGKDDELVEHFAEVVREARKKAHLVLFTPHWDAWKTPPAVTREMRSLARRLIDEAGFDAILGHGRHEIQGVEIRRGKPIIYDAGNSLLDFTGGRDPEDSRGLLWKVEFSMNGVHRLEGIPIKMTRNRTTIATGKELRKILDRTTRLSSKYGTKLKVENDRLHLELDPGGMLRPTVGPEAPKRSPRDGPVRLAPTDVLHERLPGGVTPLDVRFESGIRLVGYETPARAIVKRKCSSMVVVLYWTADQPVKDSYLVRLEARRVIDGEMEKRPFRREDHLPGDWMLPTNLWPVGKIVQDKTNVRLVRDEEPEGSVAFLVGLNKLSSRDRAGSAGKSVKPVSHSGVDLHDGTFVVLGPYPYERNIPSPRESYVEWRRTRDVELSPRQPPLGAPPLRFSEFED